MRDVGGREPVRAGHRRALRRVQAPARRPARAAAARPGRGPRATSARCATRCSTCSTTRRFDGRPAGGQRVRVRHDRPARAAARRDHARHPPAARRRAGARRAAAARAARPARPRARCWCPAGRSPWAPRPSRGRWTTSGPRTRSHVAPFVIDTAPVTNGDYLGFIDGRRLRRPALVVRGRLGARAEGRARRAAVLGAATATAGCAPRFGASRAGAARTSR